jgi:hypothetical protein
MRSRLGMLLSLTLLVSVGVKAQDNPLIGTWKLNLAKSHYSPGPPPKSGTTKITAVPGGIKLVADGVDDKGQATRASYTAKFDGKDYPEKATLGGKPNPNPNADAIAWKKIDDYTYESTAKLKGQTMTTTHYGISRDGKTRTNSVSGKNAQGQTVNNTIIYEKQ